MKGEIKEVAKKSDGNITVRIYQHTHEPEEGDVWVRFHADLFAGNQFISLNEGEIAQAKSALYEAIETIDERRRKFDAEEQDFFRA